MKSLTIAAFAAAQILAAAQPAAAAGFGDEPAGAGQKQAAFAGARLRVPLGGEGKEKARAGLAVAPVLHSRQADGSMRTRFGEGMELGFAGGPRAQLMLAGRRVSSIAQGRSGPDGAKLGTSTSKGLLIVGGILVLTAGAVALLLVSQE